MTKGGAMTPKEELLIKLCESVAPVEVWQDDEGRLCITSRRAQRASTGEDSGSDLRARMAESAKKRPGRGRPREDRLVDMGTGMRRAAWEVFERKRELGGDRGALAAAIREVAQRHGKRPEAVKKAAQRYRNLESAEAWAPGFEGLATELHDRRLGMPDDVREALNGLPAQWLRDFLRRNNINGTCPSWFVEAAREFRLALLYGQDGPPGN